MQCTNLGQKSRIREKLTVSTRSDSCTDKKQNKNIDIKKTILHVSCVMCCVSYVACHVSCVSSQMSLVTCHICYMSHDKNGSSPSLNSVERRLLVKDRIPKISKLGKHFSWQGLYNVGLYRVTSTLICFLCLLSD